MALQGEDMKSNDLFILDSAFYYAGTREYKPEGNRWNEVHVAFLAGVELAMRNNCNVNVFSSRMCERGTKGCVKCHPNPYKPPEETHNEQK